MKVPLRFLVIFVSLAIVIYAMLPPPKTETAGAQQEAPKEVANPESTDSSMIRDLLGGAQLDQGKKAKELLSEVNESKKEDLQELETFDE